MLTVRKNITLTLTSSHTAHRFIRRELLQAFNLGGGLKKKKRLLNLSSDLHLLMSPLLGGFSKAHLREQSRGR